MADSKWYGGRLRELREQAGLTQQELADQVGVKWETISRWERGEREPNWTNVMGLCSALNVSCEAFTEPPTEEIKPVKGRPPKAKEAPSAEKQNRAKPKKKKGDES